MALKNLIITHAEARDRQAVDLIDRLERHRAAIDFPTSDFKRDDRTLSRDLEAVIRLLLDYHHEFLSRFHRKHS